MNEKKISVKKNRNLLFLLFRVKVTETGQGNTSIRTTFKKWHRKIHEKMKTKFKKTQQNRT